MDVSYYRYGVDQRDVTHLMDESVFGGWVVLCDDWSAYPVTPADPVPDDEVCPDCMAER
jgi:hypothetical protein